MPLRHRPHRVIFVPLDDRPCSVKMPRLLARMVDFELIMPPLELLGQGQTPGDPESIGEWLLEQLRETADCAVVSLDMLAYGGLAASCTSSIRTQLAQERLEILRRIRSAAPSTPIYASSSIMRLAIATSSDAAARYWDAVRRYAVVSAHATQIEPSQAAVERERLEREIPGSILGEYLAIRARNHEINQRAVSEVAAGNVDFLLLCQGPAGGEGVHLDEQQELDRTIAEGHVVNRAVTCEGTDHAGTLLLARFIHTHMQKVPSVRVVYSTDEDADVMPPLESGTLSESVDKLIRIVGARRVRNGAAADLTLVVNTPAAQPPAAYRSVAARRERTRRLGEFVERLVATENGRGLAVCDVAFPQAADDVFAEKLTSSGLPLPRLLSFASADTASGSISVALSHGVLRLIALQDKGAFDLAHAIGELSPMRYLALLNSLIDAEKAHIEFLFQRLVSDWLYQTRVRPRATAHVVRLVRLGAFDLNDCARHAAEIVQDRLAHAAAELWIENFLGQDCVHIGADEYRSRLTLADLEETRTRLPWNRLAEVDVDVEFGMQLEAET